MNRRRASLSPALLVLAAWGCGPSISLGGDPHENAGIELGGHLDVESGPTSGEDTGDGEQPLGGSGYLDSTAGVDSSGTGDAGAPVFDGDTDGGEDGTTWATGGESGDGTTGGPGHDPSGGPPGGAPFGSSTTDAGGDTGPGDGETGTPADGGTGGTDDGADTGEVVGDPTRGGNGNDGGNGNGNDGGNGNGNGNDGGNGNDDNGNGDNGDNGNNNSNNMTCDQDCYFDDNAGSDDDGCSWDLQCDPANPGADLGCGFTGGLLCDAHPGPSQACIDTCEPLVPAGCDCFGCCTVALDAENSVDIFLGSGPDCSLDNLEGCRQCTPQADVCGHPCDPDACELCFGESELPPGCAAQ